MDDRCEGGELAALQLDDREKDGTALTVVQSNLTQRVSRAQLHALVAGCLIWDGKGISPS